MWSSFDVERNWRFHKKELKQTQRTDECDTLTILWLFKHDNGIFSMKSVNFTVMQLKESWLMFYNLYRCFDIFLTILLLLTINIFCTSVYVDMCSPINVVPIFTFKMRRKNLSPPPMYLFYSHYCCIHTSGTRCVEIFSHQANSLCHQLAVLRFNSIPIGSIWRHVRSHRWAQSHKTAACPPPPHTQILTQEHTHTHTF